MYQISDDTYSVMAGDRYVEILQQGSNLTFFCDEAEFKNFWYDYFDMGTDYGAMLRSIDEKDEFLMRAASFGRGIRILRQDVWEMMVTFIISQQKQIPSIRKCVEALCTGFGALYERNGKCWYGFPTAESIVAGGMEGLSDMSLGYRDRYIYETAVRFVDEEQKRAAGGEQSCGDFLRGTDYESAMKYLMGFCGIGEKVANCICLFGLGFTDAFPVDVHIKDILYREYYSKHYDMYNDSREAASRKSASIGGAEETKIKRLEKEKMSNRDYLLLIEKNFSKYKGYRGIIQQWIFAYELSVI